MKDIEFALGVFLEASAKHSEATEIGDYKSANKYYAKIVKSINFLKDENALDKLLDFVNNPAIGVRLWSACYLLPINEQVGKKVLEDIAKDNNIHSLTAETTLKGWKKGQIKF